MRPIDARFSMLLDLRRALCEGFNSAARMAALKVEPTDLVMAKDLQALYAAVSAEVARCRPPMGAPEREPVRVVPE